MKTHDKSLPGLSPGTILGLGVALVLFLSACLTLTAPATPTRDDAPIFTSGAETMNARLTLEAGQEAVAQLTQLARSATRASLDAGLTQTARSIHPTETAPPTLTLPPLPTTTPQASPTQAGPCDQGVFIADVTIPPGANLPSGAGFLKIWRIQNTGSCTWNPTYSLVFTSGDPLSSATSIPLPTVVVPGQMVDLTVSMSAPRYPGAYQGSWMLRNASGGVFGLGPSAREALVVRINAVQISIPGQFEYDLAANYCAAFWQSAAGARPCPGSASDPGGSVILVDRPALENGRHDDLGLWVRPNQNPSGWISAQFPAYTVLRDDRFLALVGCLSQSPGCELVFQLDFRTLDGATGRLGSWRETFDGRVTSIDLSLSSLVGRSVLLILSVSNNGAAGDANGVWVAPRVENVTTPSNLALEWTQEIPDEVVCNGLKIFLTGTFSAQAVAYSCEAGQIELGRTALTTDEYSQLSSFIFQLQTFKGEVFRADTVFPVSSSFTLYGTGFSSASDADIQAINSLATRLFGRITGNVIIE